MKEFGLDEMMELAIPLGLLALALVVLAVIIAKVKAWYQQDDESDLSANTMLANFRSLKDEGELSPEEFQKIKGQLTSKIRGESAVTAPPAPKSKPVRETDDEVAGEDPEDDDDLEKEP